MAASALLLFSIEPMVAKLALPRFGGSAAVWSLSLLFFQGLLLAGYAWSHYGAAVLGRRGQMAAHALLLVLSLATLPPALGAAGSKTAGAPALALLGALLGGVGLPFFLLSANSSLASRWYALSHRRDPYFLYAASNAASLIALLAYPFLVEPRLGLAAQARAWAVGYGLFAALALTSIRAAARAAAPGAERVAAPAVPVIPDGDGDRRGAPLRTAARAAVGSALLVAVSARISTDLAAVPLLWTVPLAIYLATWVLAFLPHAPYPRGVVEILAMFAVTLALAPVPWNRGASLAVDLAPPLAALFFGAWVCHADLAADRPPPARLTAFYLASSVGGFTGTALCALVAPLVSARLTEYPLALCGLALVLACGDGGAAFARALRRTTSWLAPVAIAALLGACALAIRADAVPRLEGFLKLAPLGALLCGMALWRVRGQFALACAVVAAALIAGFGSDGRLLEIRRSFYGVLRITQDRDGGETVRKMVHGTTLHGAQRIAPPGRVPSTYYHPATPMGSAVASAADDARIGVVGLGTGSLAALTRPGQSLDYFEIDPLVEPLARRWFGYLGEAGGTTRVILGDARARLAESRGGSDRGYDLLVIDAFSSDAIPIHLITLDALRLYLARLAPGGALLLHVSNRYLDLTPVARGAARALAERDVRGFIARYTPDPAALAEGATASVVVCFVRGATAPPGAATWAPLDGGPAVTWTDDRSSLLDVLRRH